MRSKDYDEEEVLGEVMAYFWQKGYDASSMDALLNHVGLSRSSFYRSFGNKRESFLAALSAYSQLTNYLANSLDPNAPTSPSEQIRHFLETSLFSLPKPLQQHGCLLINTIIEQTGNDAELALFAKRELAKVQSQIALFLSKLKKQGKLTTHSEPDDLASYVMTVIKGLRTNLREGYSDDQLRKTINLALIPIQASENA